MQRSWLARLMAIGLSIFSLALISSSGELDESFGSHGKTITDFFDRTDVGRNIVIDAQGRIVIGGSAIAPDKSEHFAIARYGVDGALDPSFDKDGRVTTKKITAEISVLEGIMGIGVQADGKIIACGRGINHGVAGVAIVRYNDDGSVDASFGEHGAAITPDINEDNHPLQMMIDASGRIIIVAASYYDYPDQAAFRVFRFNADGTLDRAFGVDGKATTIITDGINVPRAVKVDAEHNIVVAGFSGDNKYTVVRYHDDGSLDTSFGNTGIATIVFNDGGIDTLHALAIQSDGKIVVGGDVQVGSFGGLRMIDFGLARLTHDGQLDLSFNGTGKQITFFQQRAASSLWALSIQSDGKIIAVGDANIAKGLGIARYNVDGTLDEAFGVKGKQITPFGNTCHFEGVALQSDGKIVAGGYVWNGKHYDIAVARYTN